MKWYFVMLIVAIPFMFATDYLSKGPTSCADACKATSRVMASWGPVAGCVCAEAREQHVEARQ